MKVAACLAVISKDKKVLLSKRNSNIQIYPAAWVLPGGHLDPDESLEYCAVRETAEEMGIKIKNKNPEAFYAFESVNRTNFSSHLIMFFKVVLDVDADQIQLKLQKAEVEAACWLTW